MMVEETAFRKSLERAGFASTRAADLDKAVYQLHAAVCQIDTCAGQKEALEKLLNTTLRDLLNKFGETEWLRHDF